MAGMRPPRVRRSALDVWLRYLRIFADLPREIVVDFVVTRDAGRFLGDAIDIDRVVATLT
jgi:hypothetical protein